MADLEVVDLDSDAFLQVGDQLRPSFGYDEFDPVVKYQLCGCVFEQSFAFEHPDQADY